MTTTQNTTLTPHAKCPHCLDVQPVDDERRIIDHASKHNPTYTCRGAGEVIPPRFVRNLDPATPVIPEPRRVNPLIEALTADEIGDPHWHEETIVAGLKAMEAIPAHYRDAVVQAPEVVNWVRRLIGTARRDTRPMPRLDTGRSLLLLGPTGTGKTHTAYGVVRALSVCGASCAWTFITAADLYARLRPRPHVDSEDEFDRFARATFLVIDDLGAAKGTEWNEEINYRLVNYRYEHEKPTLITSNVPPKNLGDVLGERVASRLVEMADRVVLKGADRRLTSGGA